MELNNNTWILRSLDQPIDGFGPPNPARRSTCSHGKSCSNGKSCTRRRACVRSGLRRCVVAGTAACVCVAAYVDGGTPARAQPPESVPSETLTPPTAIESPPATYPPSALRERQESSVVLDVTIDAEGRVAEASVAQSGGEIFDTAAVQAVKAWKFTPARRGEEPVVSRIRVPFEFTLPSQTAVAGTSQNEASLETDPSSAGPQPTTTQADTAPAEDSTETETPSSATPSSATESSASDSEEEPMEVVVQGERTLRTEDRSVSDFRMERDIVAAAPRQEGAEVLRSAPGLYIGRAASPAVAHRYMLRGFDADHGQDIEFRVGGLPINMPSHIHGQGYADLSFLIGDVVSELRVAEGVHDPRQGDFAVAGSVYVDLGVEEERRGVALQSGYGSFNTYRQLIRWAPRGTQNESFGAAQYTRSDGFGENRSGQTASALFQHRFGSGALSYRAIGILHAARANQAGVVRQDDIDSGRVCFECVYPFPTAQAQNALSNRFMVGLFADYRPRDTRDDHSERGTHGRRGANGQLGLWLGYDDFRLQENFTGFTRISGTLDRVAGIGTGRGDLLEQQNRTLSAGITGRYRTAPYRPAWWLHGTVEVGIDGRVDGIEQQQNLLDAAVRNQTWDNIDDAGIRALDLGFWGDLDWNITRYVEARLGMRGNVLSYDINDRLFNRAPRTRPQDSFIRGFRRSALGFAFGPRASVEVKPLDWLSVLGAYGEGYRSPQARLLEDGEDAPFSKVRSVDFGVRFRASDLLTLTVGGYYTRLSDDIAFDAREGRPERIGATRRLGAVVHAVTRPFDWLVGSASLTVVDAELLEPPPPTAEEPDPPFERGQSLPFVPPVVIRTDLGVVHTLVRDLWGVPLSGRIGMGYSYLSRRPLPFAERAAPVSLLDASVALTWGVGVLSFELFNAIGSEYAAIEFNFPSDWDPADGVRPRTPARHIAAGAPRTWMLSLGVTL